MKKWMSEDCRASGIIGGSEMILKSVSLLRRKTIEDREESGDGGGWGKEGKEGEEGEGEGEEEGVSVREKNGILRIVLEVVEGGGWRGSYSELEEVVNRLEEEGKKEWISKRREKGKNFGREWKEMGRLAHEVGWGIEERRVREEGNDGEGEMISLLGMKKNLEEEKKGRDEERKGREEEKKKREESEKKVDEERRAKVQKKRRANEEKQKREESEKKAEDEKRKMEEEMKKMKEGDERWKRNLGTIMSLIRSLDDIGVELGDVNKMRKENNSIIHNNEDIWISGFVGGKLDNSVHRMFECFMILFLYYYLFII